MTLLAIVILAISVYCLMQSYRKSANDVDLYFIVGFLLLVVATGLAIFAAHIGVTP